MNTHWKPTDYFRRLAGFEVKNKNKPEIAVLPMIDPDKPKKVLPLNGVLLNHPPFRCGKTEGGGPEALFWASVHSTMITYEVVQWGATELQAKLKCLEILRTFARKRNCLKMVKAYRDKEFEKKLAKAEMDYYGQK